LKKLIKPFKKDINMTKHGPTPVSIEAKIMMYDEPEAHQGRKRGMEMNKHTPTPWAHKAKAWQDIKDHLFWHCDVIKDGIRIAKVTGRSKEEAEANARYIVTAVNFYKKHRELVGLVVKWADAAQYEAEEIMDSIVPLAQELEKESEV